MSLIRNSKYLHFLSKFGVGGAHPGGIDLTKEMLMNENIRNNSSILDIGCGTGQTAAYLAKNYGANVTGIDIDPIMVEKARKRIKEMNLPVNIIQGSIEKIPLEDYTFDFIISESVLSFVNKPTALKEIFRLLKNGGRFIANELTIYQQLEAKIEKEIKDFYGFESILMEKEWIAFFEKAGFNTMTIKKSRPIAQSHSWPEFHYSETIEPELYEIMDKHYELNSKYEKYWDYRIFSCIK